MNEAVLKKLLSTKEAAEVLDCSERKLFTLSTPRGSLPTVRIGQSVKYDVDDINAFIEKNKQRAIETKNTP